MPSPCRIDASPYTGPSLIFPAARRRWERVWSDSFSRLLVSAPERTRTRSNRQLQRMYRLTQTTEFCVNVVWRLIACCSSRSPIVSRRKTSIGGFSHRGFCSKRTYLVWNMRNSANSVAHREGKRFVVRVDEKLTAFVELESAICAARLGAARDRWARLLASACGLIAGYYCRPQRGVLLSFGKG